MQRRNNDDHSPASISLCELKTLCPKCNQMSFGVSCSRLAGLFGNFETRTTATTTRMPTLPPTRPSSATLDQLK